jgi:type VI secretion system protein ImpM
MRFGLYGKHPAFGDFIAQGLSDGLRLRLERWCEAVLAPLAASWGEGWRERFDSAPPLGLWVGPQGAGEGGFLGGVFPSADKVGRRFLLVLGWEGALAPPSLAPQAAAMVLPALRAALAGAAAADARGLCQVIGARAGMPAPPVTDPTYWAARRDGDIGQLFADAAGEEAQRGSGAGRACLWSDTPRAVLYATAGLPDAPALVWMLAGAPAHETAAPEPASDEVA